MDPSVWRIEDTRPSIVDPVDVLDAAHRSHRVSKGLCCFSMSREYKKPKHGVARAAGYNGG